MPGPIAEIITVLTTRQNSSTIIEETFECDFTSTIDISPGNLDSSLCFFQPSASHDVLCI